MRSLLVLLLVPPLFACQSSERLTAQQVIERFQAAGIELSDVHTPTPAAALPKTYDERLAFTLPTVAPHGGQVFVCAERLHCETLVQYFKDLRALTGPYVFLSPSGLVLVQLNSDLSADEAARFQQVIETIK